MHYRITESIRLENTSEIIKCHVQSFLKDFQGTVIPPSPKSNHPYSEEISHNVQPQLPPAQFKSVSPCPVQAWEKRPHRLQPPFR